MQSGVLAELEKGERTNGELMEAFGLNAQQVLRVMDTIGAEHPVYNPRRGVWAILGKEKDGCTTVKSASNAHTIRSSGQAGSRRTGAEGGPSSSGGGGLTGQSRTGAGNSPGRRMKVNSYDFGVVFSDLLLQANHAAYEAEQKLLVEENTNKIAELQGFCAGISSFKHTAAEAGIDVPPEQFDTKNRMEPWIRSLSNGDTECDLSLTKLRGIDDAFSAMRNADTYKNLEKGVDSEISKKKDWLFNEAEKGRDLLWCRGWKRGFLWVNKTVSELGYWLGVKEDAAERTRREKAESLPFGDD